MQPLPLIALYLPSLDGGGAEKVFANLARGFSEAGHPVDVLLARKRGPFLSHLPSTVRVVDLKARHVSLTLFPLIRYLRARRPAVLFSALSNANLMAIGAKRLSGASTQVVITQHGVFSQALHAAQGARAKMLLALAQRGYRHADAVVAVSKHVAEDLAACTRLAREQIEVIYNPVVTPELPAAAREAPPHPWLKSRSEPVIMGAGRLTPAKDFATLLRAFARLRRRRPARLILLGEGEERAALEALAERLDVRADLSMPGFVDNPYAYMRAASVFVLSSRWEGFGNVLVEAMACGTPVVSTDCPGGPAEILAGGTFGPLVPVGDANALAAAIGAVLEAPTPREELVRRAQDFGLERAVDGYLSLIK